MSISHFYAAFLILSLSVFLKIIESLKATRLQANIYFYRFAKERFVGFRKFFLWILIMEDME